MKISSLDPVAIQIVIKNGVPKKLNIPREYMHLAIFENKTFIRPGENGYNLLLDLKCKQIMEQKAQGEKVEPTFERLKTSENKIEATPKSNNDLETKKSALQARKERLKAIYKKAISKNQETVNDGKTESSNK